MSFELDLALAGLVGGFVVGLTGMGGGALMTPMLVLLFEINPLTAVSSDLVVSLIMKPVGAAVHIRRGTVHTRLVVWLMAGSIPAAFAGVLVLNAAGGDTSERLKRWLGAALLVAAACIVVKTRLQRRLEAADAAAGLEPGTRHLTEVRPLVTLSIGVVGGLVVGMTSVGSGSLIIVMLMLVYPRLTSAELVGTDLVQAIPLVGSAALGHLLFGDVQLDLTTSLLVGALPGIWIGAHVSAHAADAIVRPVLFLVLAATGLKLVGVL